MGNIDIHFFNFGTTASNEGNKIRPNRASAGALQKPINGHVISGKHVFARIVHLRAHHNKQSTVVPPMGNIDTHFFIHGTTASNEGNTIHPNRASAGAPQKLINGHVINRKYPYSSVINAIMVLHECDKTGISRASPGAPQQIVNGQRAINPYATHLPYMGIKVPIQTGSSCTHQRAYMSHSMCRTPT